MLVAGMGVIVLVLVSERVAEGLLVAIPVKVRVGVNAVVIEGLGVSVGEPGIRKEGGSLLTVRPSR